MILQLFPTEYRWMVGIAVAFGLALFFSVLTEPTAHVFLAWLSIFIAICVWCRLLPYWSLFAVLVLLIALMYLNIMKLNGNGSEG